MTELTLEWTPYGGRPRKLVFEHQPDAECAWARVEYERRDGHWRVVGCECLEAITLSSSESLSTSVDSLTDEDVTGFSSASTLATNGSESDE